MKFYLDTNALRQLSNRKEILSHKDVFCSQWSIFELISGIDSPDEFRRRKNILERVKNTAHIYWTSPKQILFSAFGHEIVDEDIIVTRKMLEHISLIDSFDELQQLEIEVLGTIYTLKHFLWYDNEISQSIMSQLESQPHDSHIRESIQRPEIRQTLKELSIARHIETTFNCRRCDETYLDALNHYLEIPILDDYWTAIIYLSNDAVYKGKTLGKNDAFDYGHLAYSGLVTHFVTDDKLFHRKIPSELLSVKIIKVSDFLDLIENNER